MNIVNQTKAFFEKQAFGVCTWLGEKLSIPSADIRKFFIYTSFLAIGSPVIIYLTLAFLLKLKQYFRAGRTSVWD
jgi:phage shock protein PspC (stress-responsive transcriptional regulator)